MTSPQLSATVQPAECALPLVLSIDVGTSSVRAAVFDRHGRAVDGCSGRVRHAFTTGTDGRATADPDAVLERVWHCVDLVLETVGPDQEIAAVAVAMFVSNLVGLDDAGRPVTPLITYADTRAADAAAHLREQLDEAEIHDRTGCLLHPAYWTAQLSWLEQTEPQTVERVARWCSIGGYLRQVLFGEVADSFSAASWTGLLDRRTCEWDDCLIDLLPVSRTQFPSLVDAGDGARGLRPEWTRRWPALAEVPWYPAVGDGATANVGSGCAAPTRVALTMGSTSAMRVVVEGAPAVVPDGLWCYRVDGRRSLVGGALSAGGNLYGWMQAALQLGPSEEAAAALADMSPDAHGLTILPFLAGERSPGWAGHARGTIHGITLATTSLEILRAGLEAVGYRLALIFERLPVSDEVQLVASGGALLASDVWLQIVTDIIGRPIAVSTVPEASCRGSALLALEALGALADVRDAPAFVGRQFTPNVAHHEQYREGRRRQQLLYDRLVLSPEEYI